MGFESNRVLSKKEREERVLDLHFNRNKNYRQIAQEMKMSLRDIGEIVNKAKEEKERQEHKSLSVQAYDKFSQGKTPLQVAIDLNIGQIQTTQYYSEYLKLVELEDVTKLYLEFKYDVSYFVSLCKAAKAVKMDIPQVINLLRIANNYLPSVQHRYDQLQNENNILKSVITNKSVELQNLNGQIKNNKEILQAIKSESVGETALLQGLRQQSARLGEFVYNYKNNNEDYVKLIKSIENKISDLLSNKKVFLKIAIISVIKAMRNNPEEYSALVYHNNNYNQNPLSSTTKSKDNNNNNNNLSYPSRQLMTLPPPPYDEYIIEHYNDIILEETEKLYKVLVDQLVCKVLNENVC
ncbi:MAG TPA: hypothetical protein VH796_14325 [Nitrososphaeraceae archaeon]